MSPSTWRRPAASTARAGELPYVVLSVQLAEGPMMMANLVDSDQDELQCEAPVEVTFVDATAEISLPRFRLRKG